VYLESYRVDDIDVLGGGSSDYLCGRLCCMVVVASDLRVWCVCLADCLWVVQKAELLFVSLLQQCL
jgi:hypothetical protein